MDHDVEHLALSDFINKELILFSMADNIRSLPCVVDGLKPGLRKIIFACFKRNLVKGEIKVFMHGEFHSDFRLRNCRVILPNTLRIITANSRSNRQLSV
jgi:hypothetical protein